VRTSAAEVLGQLQAKSAINPLINLLDKENNKEIRQQTLYALAQITPNHPKLKQKITETLNTLRQQAQHQFAGRRYQAAQDLAYLVAPESVALLIPLLKDRPSIQKQAILALKHISAVQPTFITPALPDLYPLLKAEHLTTRHTAIEILGDLLPQQPQLQDHLIPLLEHPATRRTTLHALAKLKTPVMAQFILELAQKQPNFSHFQYQALKALATFDFKEQIPFLKTLLTTLNQEKNTWRQRQYQQDDTIEAASCSRQYRVEKQDQWNKTHWAWQLGNTLTRLAPKQQGIPLLGHNLAKVRQGAWQALGKQQDIELLREIYQHRQSSTQPHFRYAAYQAIHHSLITLETRGGPQHLKALETWLAEVKDWAVKDRILWTVERLKYRLGRD